MKTKDKIKTARQDAEECRRLAEQASGVEQYGMASMFCRSAICFDELALILERIEIANILHSAQLITSTRDTIEVIEGHSKWLKVWKKTNEK